LVEGDERLIFIDRKGMQGRNQIFTKGCAVAYINEYYPFGLVNQQTSSTQFGSKEQRYKYNGKELFKDFKLEMEDYGVRMYSPQIGRFQTIDPMAVKRNRLSPYNYVSNNPILRIDPTGMLDGDYYDKSGNKIGTDGIDDKKKYIVEDRSEAKAIKRTNKDGGVTAVDDVKSAVLLPSDAALGEAINVLDRTTGNGGLHEESSLVMKDGSVVRGAKGGDISVVGDNTALSPTTFPNLPSGKGVGDVEASIHSHPTSLFTKDNTVYPFSATSPSAPDFSTFGQYNTNIIVGAITPYNQPQPGAIFTPSRENGAALFRGSSAKPFITISESVLRKIIK
jgi:RHS repeat-associated protein